MAKASAPADDPVRGRLIGGLLATVNERGYASATIADVVRRARVSKRTFYEHFSDKESCFLAAYAQASELTLRSIEAAADPALPWDDRILAAVNAYVRALEAAPRLTRTFFLEIHAAGPGAIEKRGEIHRRFAELIQRLVEEGRKKYPKLLPLSPGMAIAIVGGINEMVLVALETRRGKLHDVVPTAVELVRAVLAPRKKG